MSNSLLEAMATALPCVVSGIGGNTDLIADGRTGRLVGEPTPAAWSDALLELLDDPADGPATRRGGAPADRRGIRPPRRRRPIPRALSPDDRRDLARMRVPPEGAAGQQQRHETSPQLRRYPHWSYLPDLTSRSRTNWDENQAD